MLLNLEKTRHKRTKAKAGKIVGFFTNTIVVIQLLGQVCTGLAPAQRAAL